MRFVFLMFCLFSPVVAAAHPGHIVDVAGHNHWIAIGAIGAAGLAALWGKLKGKNEAGADDADAELDEADLEEETA